MKLSLARALHASQTSSIAFVGAGGKSTAMFELAREFAGTIIVTATSHLGVWQIPLADFHIIAKDQDSLNSSDLDKNGIILITGEIEDNRTTPINAELLTWLHSYCRSNSIPLLIEADGSRQKPLKGWANHEPPIPEFVDQVVHVVGMSGLGKPLTDEHVHRAEIFSKTCKLELGNSITPDAIVQLLSHTDGGQKNVPQGTKKTLLLNQADTPEIQSLAHTMVEDLLPHFPSIIVGSLGSEVIHAVHEPIAGIILAAGKSSRFGKPKQLLDWKGEPFVRVVARTALRAGLSPVIVVTGAHHQQIEEELKDLDVLIVRNEEWKTGQGSSIKAGVSSVSTECGGAIFLLADQPHMGASIIHALTEKHAEGLHPIVAPMVLDRRANPVLFDRAAFSDLMQIEGDTGGRAIFHKHRVEYLPWHDDGLLLDVDTPEQYERLISNRDI